MTSDEYSAAVATLPFGKKLPDAVYVFSMEGALPEPLHSLVHSLRQRLQLDDKFNVVKFSTDFAVSFLEYRDYFTDPHPPLVKAIRVNLAAGKVKELEYDIHSNPPILHRKETLLPHDHPDRRRFAALTQQEEDAGLFDDPRTIGFRANWQSLLHDKGLGYEGHSLVRLKETSLDLLVPETPVHVYRHRTAMTRSTLSKPVRQAIECGLLSDDKSFFDYGCGLGTDADGLRALGYDASAWDPAYFPDAPKKAADVVNLGYVLNVIENPPERIAVLVDAWEHTRQVLIISTMISGRESYECAREHRDGLLTSRNTFQKYFEPREIQGLIESALETDAYPLGIGIYAVFRNPKDGQAFLAARSRRNINWEQISSRLGFLRPRKRAGVIDLYEQNKDLLDEFWTVAVNLGRVPVAGEFARNAELKARIGGPRKVHRLFLDHYGPDVFEAARKQRKEDLLVYLAAAGFRKRIPLRHLDDTLQADLESHFGGYRQAQEEGTHLLMSLGEPLTLSDAAASVSFGWRDNAEGHLSIHSSLVDRLPAVLRVFIECGLRLYGVATEADIIKIHLRSRKLTFLQYDAFSRAAFPVLQTRIKIDLPRLTVSIFEYGEPSSRQLLFFKERFVDDGFPGRSRMEQISRRVEMLGIRQSELGPNDQNAPSKPDFDALLERYRLRPDLTKRPAEVKKKS
jgi:DNA phosphorothioation-associated putative methyltransferase